MGRWGNPDGRSHWECVSYLVKLYAWFQFVHAISVGAWERCDEAVSGYMECLPRMEGSGLIGTVQPGNATQDTYRCLSHV